ncbi:Myb-like domain [Ceraceosorus bombacis]|uniref:Myb-like domain n=1 Tax=Ceraceosorus bombacis TaxID=401625 RepID=A0A0P1BB73_9BASI|nr:Myb-like domain [Ceraceosorus bombacis]
MEYGSSPSGSPSTPTKRQSEGVPARRASAVFDSLIFESNLVHVKSLASAADTLICPSKTPKKEARSSTTHRSPRKVKPEPHDDQRSGLEEQGQSSKRGGARTAWKPSEKKALVLGMCEAGMAHVDWTRMSEQCGGRSTTQIKSYWRMVLKNQLEKSLDS